MNRLWSYYFSFDATGADEIDEILAAVAQAGKAHHHTEDWSDPGPDGVSEQDKIQAAAIAAAAAFKRRRGATDA